MGLRSKRGTSSPPTVCLSPLSSCTKLTQPPHLPGVLHTVPSLLLPSGSLALTAEKYLIALNATKFVSLLRSVNLSHYVQIPSRHQSEIPSSLASAAEGYTILAPNDDILNSRSLVSASSGGGGWKENFPEEGSEALRELLQYHIVPGRWTPEDLEEGMLVGTELRGPLLKGARQRLLVSVQSEEEMGVRGGERGWTLKDGKKKNLAVGFGGASVLGEPGEFLVFLASLFVALADILNPFPSQSRQLDHLPHFFRSPTPLLNSHHGRLGPPSLHIRRLRLLRLVRQSPLLRPRDHLPRPRQPGLHLPRFNHVLPSPPRGEGRAWLSTPISRNRRDRLRR